MLALLHMDAGAMPVGRLVQRQPIAAGAVITRCELLLEIVDPATASPFTWTNSVAGWTTNGNDTTPLYTLATNPTITTANDVAVFGGLYTVVKLAETTDKSFTGVHYDYWPMYFVDINTGYHMVIGKSDRCLVIAYGDHSFETFAKDVNRVVVRLRSQRN